MKKGGNRSRETRPVKPFASAAARYSAASTSPNVVTIFWTSNS